jgi:protein-S-isoprenylcysteine O-methyltransferase Ste14
LGSEAPAVVEGRLLGFLGRHRILISRVFALAFFCVLLVMDSRQEGSLIAPILFFSGLLLVGIATIGRLWCSLYISGLKNTALVTVGPYSITRNPLYLFSFIGFAGVGLATETITLALVMVAFFAAIYPFIIRREEGSLHNRFGKSFADYCALVPRFLPRFSRYVEPPTWSVDTRRFRRSMLEVIWFVWLVALIELVEAIHELGFAEPWIRLY